MTLPTPTKTGYTFMGWYLDEDCTISATLTSMPSENTTLYASWEAIERNIWYSIVGGMILILGIGLMFLLIRQKKYEQENQIK
ncbi:MAG: InlB B-repeat-containing protein [Clostridia bacterium]|nr:InlB B-repeat-containing protein [Clostridia bacterium]